MAATVSKLLWLHNLLSSLGIQVTESMKLYCANQATMHIAFNPVFHERTKQVDMDCLFVWEHVNSDAIIMVYLPSKQQLAYMFTKVLGKKRFIFLVHKLGIHNIHAPT